MIHLPKDYKRFDSSHIPVCDCYGNLHYKSLNVNKDDDTITKEYKQKYTWCAMHRLLSTLIKNGEYKYCDYKRVFDVANSFYILHHKDIKIANNFIQIFDKRYGEIYNTESKTRYNLKYNPKTQNT